MEQIKQLDSMYAEYKAEFESSFTVWQPNIGFANYKLEDQDDHGIGIYVQEVYVRPEHRGHNWAAKLTDKCIEDATKRFDAKIRTVYTTIGIGGATIDLSVRAITAYGFKIFKADPELIYFYKEIDHE